MLALLALVLPLHIGKLKYVISERLWWPAKIPFMKFWPFLLYTVIKTTEFPE